jgi:hypothetical protein
MKMSLIALVILLTLDTSGQQVPGKDPVSEKVLISFQKEFAKAINISWMPEKNKTIYHAKFEYNDEPVEAFFTEDGTLVSTARFISERKLPILIMRELADQYSGYNIRQVVEFTNEAETSYVVNAFNSKETIIVKFYTNGDTQQVKRIKNKL